MTDDDWTAEQIGALIRQCFVADEGRQLVSVDFSQIEARVLLWLAGDEEGLEVFRRFDAKAGPDVYCVAATKMFGETITKDDPRRQAGKVAVLSCLAAGTQVVTDSGLKAIEQVLPSDRLWDGVEWVTHDGLVERGSRECMNLHGVWLTGDHLVLSETGWKRADTPDLSPAWCSAPSEWSGSFSALQEGSTSRSAYALAGLRLSQLLRTSVRATPPDAAIAPGAQAIPLPARPTATRPSSLTLNCGERGLDGSPQLSPGAKTLATEGGRTTEAEGSEFTGRGFETAVGSCATSLVSTAGWISPENSTGSTTTGDTSLGISEWPLALSSAATPGSPEVGVSKEPASGAAGPFSRPSGSAATAGSRARVELPTFDLLNAGPRSRFALACGLIVHNCGFAAGPDAVDRFAAKSAINLANAGTTSLAVVEGWRRATPLVAGREIGKTFVDEKGRERQVRRGGLWRELESAARDAIQGGDGSPWWRFDGTDLYLLLPSGRAMRYRHARVEAHEKHGKVKDTILFFNPEKNRRVATYGGKLTENCFTRDCVVATRRGMVPIVQVVPGDLVWDGVTWVRTDGPVSRGVQEVGEWLGVRVTSSHKILDGTSWRTVSETSSDARVTSRFLATGRALACSSWCLPTPTGSGAASSAPATVGAVGLVSHGPSVEGSIGALSADGRPAERNVRSGPTSFLTQPSGPPGRTATPAWCPGAATPTTPPTRTTAAEGSRSTDPGSATAGSSSSMFSRSLGSTSPALTSTGSTTTGDTSLGISTWSLAARTALTAEAPSALKSEESGSRSPTSGLGSAPSGTATRSSTTSTEADLATGSWRTTGEREEVFDLLNCGPRARFTILTVAGPVIAHNCVQAVARDLLADAMVRVEEVAPIVMHTHDNIVAESDRPEEHLAEILQIMTTPPAWAAGLPVGADGHFGRRFTK